MGQYFVNDLLIFDTAVRRIGDYPGFAPTLRAGRYIDVEHPLQALRPSHGLVTLLLRVLVFILMTGTALAALGGSHVETVFAVRCKHTVESCQVYPWLGNQRGQFGNEVTRYFERQLHALRCSVKLIQAFLVF